MKERAERHLEKRAGDLREQQGLLWSSDVYALLVVLQGMDAAGKDGVIEHVMTGMNPQGVDVWPFKEPSREELEHDFLWRCTKVLPERGHIGVFNRSYYEEVLRRPRAPGAVGPGAEPREAAGEGPLEAALRFDQPLQSASLVVNGTVVVKFFLHVSKEEQRERFLSRLDDPEKRWKFSMRDVQDRQHWDEYVKAYEDVLEAIEHGGRAVVRRPRGPQVVRPRDRGGRPGGDDARAAPRVPEDPAGAEPGARRGPPASRAGEGEGEG